MTEHLFSDLKVVDCGSYIAAPAAATMLGDFGADVVKIEPPHSGDVYRRLPKLPGNPRGDDNYAWTLDARNKRSLALDLRNPSAQEVLHRLAAQADVFITNYPLKSRERFGFPYETLAAGNPRLIYASFTGYGETGKEAHKPGYDVTAWWARSGMMDVARAHATDTPVRPTVGMGDHPAAISLFAAILIALYRRQQTGTGTYVSSSLLANGIWANSYMAQAALLGATMVPRPPRVEALNALSSYYKCSDGRWLILTMLNEERDWPILARCLGLADLIDNPRFATRKDRHANSVALVAELDVAFGSKDRDIWQRALHEHGLVFEVVAAVEEIPNDQQLVDNGIVIPTADGVTMTVSGPLDVQGAPKVTPRRPPDIGEHTDEVLAEVGYDVAAIKALHTNGAVA